MWFREQARGGTPPHHHTRQVSPHSPMPWVPVKPPTEPAWVDLLNRAAALLKGSKD